MEPVVTGAPPAETEAVNVTFVSDATDDEESVSVVVEGSGAACAAVAKPQATVSTSLEVRQREDTTRLRAERNTFHIETFLGSHFTTLVHFFLECEARLILSTNVKQVPNAAPS